MSDASRSEHQQFLPTASLDRLQLRATILAFIRKFFNENGYWEVETPALSADIVVDVHLEPFVTQWCAEGVPAEQGNNAAPYFLQTSPEFGMKRLLAAGAQAIFQISKAYRNGEKGRIHNPEFTMIEWYRVAETYHQQMEFTERLVQAVINETASLMTTQGETPPKHFDHKNAHFGRVTYDEGFQREAGTSVLNSSASELAALIEGHEIVIPPGLDLEDRDALLNLLLAELVSPRLGQCTPEFLYDYPASQAALAQIRNADPPVAERFELFCHGIELCNGYQELTDADELQRRIAEQSQQRASLGRRTLPANSQLLEAMKAGLPECSGVALGFDRLFMLATGATTLREVLAFPFDRA